MVDQKAGVHVVNSFMLLSKSRDKQKINYNTIKKNIGTHILQYKIPPSQSRYIFLAALSSSRSLVVGSFVGPSVRHFCEKVTLRVSNGYLNLPTYLPM